jgi:hypothetical protein
MRKININGNVWEYSVGNLNVVIQFPNGSKKKRVVHFASLIGKKDWEYYPITPHLVKKYIIENLEE